VFSAKISTKPSIHQSVHTRQMQIMSGVAPHVPKCVWQGNIQGTLCLHPHLGTDDKIPQSHALLQLFVHPQQGRPSPQYTMAAALAQALHS